MVVTETWEAVTPLVDDEPAPAYHEPWTPQIGQRVRVRLSGECRVDWSSVKIASRLAEIGWAGHVPGEDGRTGRVQGHCLRIGCPLCGAKALGHHINIVWDKPLAFDGEVWVSAHYAACELEPIP